jgi:hypothetical protein
MVQEVGSVFAGAELKSKMAVIGFVKDDPSPLLRKRW